jgi:hypothetical protein
MLPLALILMLLALELYLNELNHRSLFRFPCFIRFDVWIDLIAGCNSQNNPSPPLILKHLRLLAYSRFEHVNLQCMYVMLDEEDVFHHLLFQVVISCQNPEVAEHVCLLWHLSEEMQNTTCETQGLGGSFRLEFEANRWKGGEMCNPDRTEGI